MSLLSIIQSTCDRIGITRPAAVVSSTDAQVRQLYALLNEGGLALSKRCDWEVLTEQWTFVTVAQAEQTNTPTPTDLRKLIPDTFYNRTSARKLLGPITPQQWQQLQARPALSDIYLAFRKRQGDFLITPSPTAGETIAYEYVSENWVMSSAGVGKASFTSDDDDTFLDDELLKQDLRWRWRQAKGLPYAEDMETFERSLEMAIGNDGGATALDQGGPEANFPDRLVNIPEGGFGV